MTNSLIFELDFTDEDIALFDAQAISIFEFNIVFITGPLDKSENTMKIKNVWEPKVPFQYKEIKTNIPENIFRIIDLSINLKTVPYMNLLDPEYGEEPAQFTIQTNDPIILEIKNVKVTNLIIFCI